MNTPRPPDTSEAYRPDIDGLRAIAVMAVVLRSRLYYHIEW